MIVKPMVSSAYEALGSMGDDTPLAVLSLQPRPPLHLLQAALRTGHQSPHRPLREKLVMSLNTTIGWRRNWLGEGPEQARMIQAPSPILFPNEFEAIRSLPGHDHTSATVSCVWPLAEGEAGLEKPSSAFARTPATP